MKLVKYLFWVLLLMVSLVFLVQLNEFSECVLIGKNPVYPAEDGLNNTRVLEALYESSKTGKRVLINS